MVPYEATTQDITVTVRPDFFEKRFVFGYFVEIMNHSLVEVQLLRRYWRITEHTGRVQEVEGEGVIGKQPVIAPGDSHKYSSYSVLGSLTGMMEGHYLMQRPDGDRFRVTIPRFDLRAHAN